MHSKLRPESEDKSKLIDEIINFTPSHIVYLPQHLLTGGFYFIYFIFVLLKKKKSLESIDVYNEFGPNNVLKNSRDNLFGPLNIANICSKLDGIHFTYFGAETLQTLKELLNTENESDKNIASFYII